MSVSVIKPKQDNYLRNYTVNLWSVDDLIPYENNPRSNDHVISQGAEIVRKFGFRIPVLAKSSGEVVDGHFRLKIAHYLKMRQVPVVLADDMSETEIKAFRISVNKMADLADWDEEKLSIELKGIMEEGFSDVGAIGFTNDEIGKIMSKFGETTVDLDSGKFQGDKKSIGGDRFLLMLEFQDEDALREMFDEMSNRGVNVKVLS